MSLLMSWVSSKQALQDCAGANLSGEGGMQRQSKVGLLLDSRLLRLISAASQCAQHASSHRNKSKQYNNANIHLYLQNRHISLT